MMYRHRTVRLKPFGNWGFVALLCLAGTGCFSPNVDSDDNDEDAVNENEAVEAAPKKHGIDIKVGTTQEIGDYDVLIKENPGLAPENESEQQQEKKGYLRAVTSSLRDKRSQASQFGLEQAIRLHHAQYEKYPTYDEFLAMVKQNRSRFPELPPHKVYAYREETGEVLILIDKGNGQSTGSGQN